MLERKTVSQCVSSDYCMGWNDAVDAMPKWISVEERLPKDGQRVVGIAKNGMTGIMDYKADSTPFASRIFGRCFSEIIWWTPLPEPPEDEDED